AEDGIRDRNVTGVQTCALPIFVTTCAAGPSLPKYVAGWSFLNRRYTLSCSMYGRRLKNTDGSPAPTGAPVPTSVSGGSLPPEARSEERRVGKECRVRSAVGQRR